LLLKKETFQTTNREKKKCTEHNPGINPNKSAPRGRAVIIMYIIAKFAVVKLKENAHSTRYSLEFPKQK
jgi:hypothetical protein